MAVTDQARNQLYNHVRETWGEEVATTMMELLPPAGWADVARQRDMDLRFDSIERQLTQTNRFIGWMLASNAAVIGVVTLVVTLAR
jgi:hypothetical protein